MNYKTNRPGEDFTVSELGVLASLDILGTTPTGYHISKNALGNFVNTPDTGGSSSTEWVTLVVGVKTTPLFLETIASGDVYQYVYSGSSGDVTLFRLIPNPYVFSNDKFYSTFSSPNLSGLVASRNTVL